VTVLIDTNAFLMTSQFRIDLLEELRWMMGVRHPAVIPGVLRELEGLTRIKGKDGAAARIGLQFARHCTVVQTDQPDDGPVDDQILSYATRERCTVVTNDRNLRDRLLKEGLEVISLKGRQKLEIIRR
jgi:rRNA-processing protein FCF1